MPFAGTAAVYRLLVDITFAVIFGVIWSFRRSDKSVVSSRKNSLRQTIKSLDTILLLSLFQKFGKNDRMIMYFIAGGI